MLTLVAAVLTYDCALENCERWSSRSEFRYATSETRAEKDMMAVVEDAVVYEETWLDLGDKL